MGRAARLLAPALLLAYIEPAADPASAQALAQNQGLVVRDGTLGIEPPGVVAPGPDDLGTASYLIRADLGEQRGGNLFHSFSRFSIGSGERATFTADGAPNPGAIDNVISRVTGSDPSQIDGMLHSTIPGADVWLLNPKGVVFGAGAQLDVPASFHASTGDYVRFGTDGLERFYSDPSRASVLSTATPMAFGFLSETGAALLAVDRSALEVPDGETLELSGGDVSLTLDAALRAPGGDVRLEAQGTVGISQSLVDVGRTGDTPGTISIRGGRIIVERSSLVRAENESDVPPPVEDAAQPGPGSIAMKASESVLVDASLLSVSTHGAGNAGTIEIASPEITLRQGLGFDPLAPSRETRAGVSAETTSSGKAGTIKLQAEDLVTLANGIGVSASAVDTGASGGAGNVEIAARKVELKRGSHVSAETAGAGHGGTISIEAGESLLVDDHSLLSVSTDAAGDAGTIRIASPEVTFSNGRGFVDPNWNPVEIDSGARAETTSSGAAGHIFIDAGQLTLRDGVGVSVEAVGERKAVARGAAGTVEIHADSVEVADRSLIAAAGFGSTGKVGTILIDVGDTGTLTLDGETKTSAPVKYAMVIAANGGTPGSIEIQGHSVELKNGGVIAAFSDIGDAAGTIAIDVDKVLVDSGSIDAKSTTAGNAGTIRIGSPLKPVKELTLTSEGAIDAHTLGSGHGGTIDINADTIEQRGIINSGTNGKGDAGSVTVTADSVRIEGESAFINVSSVRPTDAPAGFVTGNAGTIDVEARASIVLTNEGGTRHTVAEALLNDPSLFTGIFSATIGGREGGSIILNAPSITVTDGAAVATSTLSGGQGGTIDLIGDRILVANGGYVDSTSLPDPRLSDPGHSGDAGAVTFVAKEWIEVSGRHEDFGVGRVSSLSLGSGTAGAVTLHAPRITVDGGAVVTTALPSAVQQREGTRGGAITLDAAHELLVTNGGRVDTSTFIAGEGGSIHATTGQWIRVEGEGSGIASRTAGTRPGGTVSLLAPRIEIRGGGEVSAESAPGFGPLAELFDPTGIFEGLIGPVNQEANRVTGDAGAVTIAATKLVHLDDGDITTSVGVATGGNITIDPELVLLENGSRILATAGTGHGGAILITADNYFAFPGSVVSAASGNQELSGTVEVHSPDVNLAGQVTPLPASFLDASSLMRASCAARASGERAGSFAVRGSGGIPPEPDGWLRASVSLDGGPEPAAPSASLDESVVGPLLAYRTCP